MLCQLSYGPGEICSAPERLRVICSRIVSRHGSSYSREAVLPKPLRRMITDFRRRVYHSKIEAAGPLGRDGGRAGEPIRPNLGRGRSTNGQRPDQIHEAPIEAADAFVVFRQTDLGGRNSGTLTHASQPATAAVTLWFGRLGGSTAPSVLGRHSTVPRTGESTSSTVRGRETNRCSEQSPSINFFCRWFNT